MADKRDQPGTLGDQPLDEFKEEQFRVRTAQQDTGRKPGQDKPGTKSVEASCQGSTGHAQKLPDRNG